MSLVVTICQVLCYVLYCIISFHPHSNPVKLMPLLSPFYKWRRWILGRLRIFLVQGHPNRKWENWDLPDWLILALDHCGALSVFMEHTVHWGTKEYDLQLCCVSAPDELCMECYGLPERLQVQDKLLCVAWLDIVSYYYGNQNDRNKRY
jgi:hypothetical protein